MKNEIEKIIQNLTLEEKAMLLTGTDDVHTASIPKLGIDAKTLVDGPHGVRLDIEKNCTQFPNLCCLAATWNEAAAYRMGEALARECARQNVDMLLAPGINIKRTPLCGRNFEYLSEDPVVAGKLSSGYIKGLQDNGVACSLKHFAVNNQEKYRTVISVEIDERTLREIYLKGFEIAVKEAKPESVMCAYNKVNSIWCSENRFLLSEILRDEWEYDGFVVSDWGAVHDSVKALKAGLDLQMPPNPDIADEIKQGLESGEITMDEIDKAVERVLGFMLKPKNKAPHYDRDSQHKIASEIASEGIVLLKNDGILPLCGDKYKKIGVIGEFAQNPLITGQGSAEVHPENEYIDSPLRKLEELLPNAEIEYREMFRKSVYSENMLWPELYQPDFVEFIKRSDVVVLFAGSMTSEDSEMFDRRSIELNPNYERVMEAVAEHGKKVILVLQTGSAVMLDRVKDTASAIVQMWLGGEGAGAAVAEILCGRVNPSGKLPETFPTKLRTDTDYPGNGRYVKYNEGVEVGYRYYDKHPEEICYPFGHGLSYSEFLYSEMNVQKSDGDYSVKFKLKNIGKYDGAEVVQLYISDAVSTVSKPEKELKHFKKIFLKAGEEKEISIDLSDDDFSYYNTMLHGWVAENGLYKVMIGSSSRDIRLEEEIYYDEKMPYSLRKVGDAMVGDTNVCFG